MRVERLALRHFRNVEDSEFFPDPNLNFLLGSNGQGKTSFLEALGFLSTLRSFRDSKTQEVVQWGQSHSEIICKIVPEESVDFTTDLKIVFDSESEERKKTSKTAFINGKAFHSSTQYLSQRFGTFHLGFHTVVFNPSDHDLVRGDPGGRRSFLDRVLAAEDVEYLKALSRYQRILSQRNAVLKQGTSKMLLEEFTEPLASGAAFIAYKRLGWLKRLSEPLNNTARIIAPKQPELTWNYLTNWFPGNNQFPNHSNNLNTVYFTGHDELPSLELLRQSFLKKADEMAAAEWRVGHSLVGPHRDDWAFLLAQQALKGHGSQGEVRSSLLALKLSEIELFRNATGHRPLFLLDDFSSELDRERRTFLLDFLMTTDLQVFVTTTEEISFKGKSFQVSGGKISVTNRSPQASNMETPPNLEMSELNGIR